MNQIHGLLLTAPAFVRQDYRVLEGENQVAVLRWSRSARESDPRMVATRILKRLEIRYVPLRAEIAVIESQLDTLITALNPNPLALCAVGVVTLATGAVEPRSQGIHVA